MRKVPFWLKYRNSSLSVLFVNLIFALLSIFESNTSHAQNTTEQGLFWMRVQSEKKWDSGWSVKGESEVRSFLKNNRIDQFIIPRIHVSYELKNEMKVSAGFAQFLHADPSFPEKDIDNIRREWRPHQTLFMNKKISDKLRLQHRYILEERFFVNNSQLQQFNFRFRYRLKFQYSLWKQNALERLSAYAYDECILNAGGGFRYNIFDQNRMGAGLSYRLNRYIQFNLSYINWFQQLSSGNEFFLRHILRFQINHTW